MKKHCFLILGLLALIVMFAGIGVFATEEEPTLEISAKALELEAAVGISFAVPTEPAKGADVKLLVWNEPRTDGYLYGTQNYILDPSDEDTVDGVLCTVFTYDGLAAKQMTDSIYVRAYAVVDGNTYYSNTEKYSVLQYAYNKLGKTDVATDDEKLKSTLTALLEYGTKAQLLFDYNTDRLANSSFYQLSVVDGCIASDLSCDGLYLTGEQVAFIANAENGESVPFSHWENSAGETVGEEICLTVTVGTSNEVYTAVYENIESEPPAVQKVAIEVINGNITNPSADQLYEIGSVIELVANENDAACFAYWQTASGEILSEDSTYTVTVGENAEVYTAVYATEYEYFEFTNITTVSCSAYLKSGSNFENVVVPKYSKDGILVTTITEDCFKNNTIIKTIQLPSSITILPIKAFSGCTALQTVLMERCEGITAVPNECFYNCKKLTTVALPNSIQSIGTSAFNTCEKLTSFTVKKNVVSIGAYAFKGCKLLTTVIFDEMNGWNRDSNPVSSSDLIDAETAAAKLKESSSAVWTRTTN